MPPSIPPRFSPVSTAKDAQGYHSVIGIVVDCLPKTKSGGTSFAVTFTLKDSGYGPGNPTWEGLKVKYFNNEEHQLPDVKVNDVVLLRKLRVRPYHGSLQGVVANTDHVSWAVFRQPDGPESLAMPAYSPGSRPLSFEEKAYANSLLNSVVHAGPQVPSSQTKGQPVGPSTQVKPKPTNKRDRFTLIKSVTPNTFADLIVHVVKTWYDDNTVNLYVTDYTVNKSLFNYGDDNSDEEEDEGRTGDNFGYLGKSTRANRIWRGPHGRMTLQVTLWDPHSAYAKENVLEDSYVSLSNVHLKSERQNGRTEGIMHTDRMYPDKVQIRVLDDEDDDPRFLELKKRKHEHWRQNKLKRGQIAEELGEEGRTKKTSKKRRKEQLRQKEQQQRQEAVRKREEGQPELAAILRADKANPHIQAKNPAKVCRTLSDILANGSHVVSLPGGIEYRLPFQNVKYRTTVRVVDFFPPDISDFAVSYNPEYETSGSETDEDESLRRVRWEWRFCLLVEDAKIAPNQARNRVKLFVSGAEAEFLLKLDAVEYEWPEN
ncbi:Protection of telomeres protein 1 [Talaromyces islandicus]|uniref:Protection of telomeres protein 1 n=1 Tax=Talaromyces islandicus TaxID=28573 RepID=A0A0U1LL17_TALIS|nr:Protection of telomeres protein 1 [Talaromyces islandicus]